MAKKLVSVLLVVLLLTALMAPALAAGKYSQKWTVKTGSKKWYQPRAQVTIKNYYKGKAMVIYYKNGGAWHSFNLAYNKSHNISLDPNSTYTILVSGLATAGVSKCNCDVWVKSGNATVR